MRIGLVIYGSLSTVSGGYLYDRILVEHLRSQGDRVEVVSIPWRSYLYHLGDNISHRLTKRLSEGDFDLLLQDELNHPSLFLINRRVRGTNDYPIISIVHHLRCSENRPSWQNHFYRIIERAYLGSVGGFIFNSQATETAVLDVLGDAKSGDHLASIIAPPGGDRLKPDITDKEISLRAHQPGPLNLLFIGNLIQRKGLHILLSALAERSLNSIRLSVVGSDKVDVKYSDTIKKMLFKLDLKGRVSLSGHLPDAALRSRMEKSHLLVVPSEYEGFGIVYLEGMGFGLPAIATNQGGAGQIVTDQYNGYLIKPGDVDKLSAIIQRLDQDRNLLERLSLNAHKSYNTHPTWAQTCHHIRDFLQRTAIERI